MKVYKTGLKVITYPYVLFIIFSHTDTILPQISFLT